MVEETIRELSENDSLSTVCCASQMALVVVWKPKEKTEKWQPDIIKRAIWDKLQRRRPEIKKDLSRNNSQRKQGLFLHDSRYSVRYLVESSQLQSYNWSDWSTHSYWANVYLLIWCVRFDHVGMCNVFDWILFELMMNPAYVEWFSLELRLKVCVLTKESIEWIFDANALQYNQFVNDKNHHQFRIHWDQNCCHTKCNSLMLRRESHDDLFFLLHNAKTRYEA